MDAPKSAYKTADSNLMRVSVNGFSSPSNRDNFVAKFLVEPSSVASGSRHGYFESTDTVAQKIAKIKTIFGLDDILCINSGGSSVGFIGLAYASLGRNRTRHNLTYRLGSIKVSGSGSEMVCFNDAGLNTVPQLYAVIQYAFQNNVFALFSLMRSWYGYSNIEISTKFSSESSWTSQMSGNYQPCSYDGYSGINPVGEAFRLSNLSNDDNTLQIKKRAYNAEGDLTETESVSLLASVTIFNVNRLNNADDYWDETGTPYILVAWTSMAPVLRGMVQHGDPNPWADITTEGGSGGVIADTYYSGSNLYTGGGVTRDGALYDMYNGGYGGGNALPSGYYVITKTTGIQVSKGTKSLIYKFFKPKQRSHSVNSFYIDVTATFGEAPHNVGDPIRYMMKIRASWRIVGEGTDVPGSATVTISAMDFSTTQGGTAVLVEGLESDFPASGITLTIPTGSTVSEPTYIESSLYYYDYEGSGWTGFVRARASASSSSTISGTVEASTEVTLQATE